MDTFVRMSRALLSVPFLYALSALTLCRRFMSIIFFQHQAAAHALVSRRSVFFAFCLPLFCLLFALSTCFRFLLLASLPSSLSFSTRQLLSSTYSAMLFCLRLYIMCECLLCVCIPPP